MANNKNSSSPPLAGAFEEALSTCLSSREVKLHIFEFLNEVPDMHFSFTWENPDSGQIEIIDLDRCHTDPEILGRLPMKELINTAIVSLEQYVSSGAGGGRPALHKLLKVSGIASGDQDAGPRPFPAMPDGSDIGLVLSGGALLGSFQAGAIEYMVDGQRNLNASRVNQEGNSDDGEDVEEEQAGDASSAGQGSNWPRFRPAAISGTSVGSINGVAISYFKENSATELTDIWEKIVSQSDFITADPEVAEIQRLVNKLLPSSLYRPDVMSMLTPFPGIRNRRFRKSRSRRMMLALAKYFLFASGRMRPLRLIAALLHARRLFSHFKTYGDGWDLQGLVTHEPIQKKLYGKIGDDYGDLSPIPFICPATALDDSNEYVFDNDGRVYKYSYHDDFSRIQAVYRVEYLELSRDVYKSLAGCLPPGITPVEKKKLKHPADREESRPDGGAYDTLYLHLDNSVAPDSLKLLKYQVLPGVIGSSNIPLALGTINAILRPTGSGAPTNIQIVNMRKIHMVDGALRLNFPMNLLLNHFKARRTVVPGSSAPIPDISRLITVSATTRSKEYKSFRDDGEEGVQIHENLGRAVDIVLNQIGNASRTSVEMIHGPALRSVSHIDPVIEVHSGYVVDPGLIRISMDYGRMRAYDILDLYPDLHAGGSSVPGLAGSMVFFQMMSLELAILRKKTWSLEQTIILSIKDNRPRYYDILADMPLLEDISVDLNAQSMKRISKIWRRSQRLMDRRKRRFRDPRRDAVFGAKTVGENIELWKRAKTDIICLENLRKNVLPGGAPISRAPSGSEFEEHQAEIGAVLKPLMFYGFWPVVR